MTAILAIDTAANACSAAISVDDRITASCYQEMVRGHAEHLVPMVGKIAEEADCALKKIDLVAVTVGPGAFTGLRVGLAAARGFALSAGVPCLGMTTLEVIAAAIVDIPSSLMVVLNSKRDDVYCQVFDPNGHPLTKPAIVTPTKISEIARRYITGSSPLVLAGNAAPDTNEYLVRAGIQTEILPYQYPDASILAKLAALRWSQGSPIVRPAPMYLRSADAALPVLGGRLRPSFSG